MSGPIFHTYTPALTLAGTQLFRVGGYAFSPLANED